MPLASPPPLNPHRQQLLWQIVHPSLLMTIESSTGGKWCGNLFDVQGELTISRTINYLHRLGLRPFNDNNMPSTSIGSEAQSPTHLLHDPFGEHTLFRSSRGIRWFDVPDPVNRMKAAVGTNRIVSLFLPRQSMHSQKSLSDFYTGGWELQQETWGASDELVGGPVWRADKLERRTSL